MSAPSDREEGAERLPALFLVAGAAVALVSIPLAASAGGPYLSVESLNPWLVAYAVGLFTASFATPFAVHRGLGGLLEADSRWERALLVWGGITLVVLGVGLLLGLPSGFGSDSLAGSIGALTIGESVLVLATLCVWLISG